MRGVGIGGGARHRRARVGDQPLDQRDRLWRRGDQLARPGPKPQTELQIVEGLVGRAPIRQFVAPGGVELRPAQLLGIVGRERGRHRAVRPFQPPPRRGPCRAFAARRMAQNAGRAFDHHLAGVMRGLADQRDVERALLGIGLRTKGLRAHPFGPCPCLAGAAAPEHQPCRPRRAIVGVQRRLLMRVRQRDEVVFKRLQQARRQRRHQLRQQPGF